MMKVVSPTNPMIQKLKKWALFENPWRSGFLLFGCNLFLFTSISGLLYMQMLFLLPYIHIVIMLLGVLTSLYCWLVLFHCYYGPEKGRLIMGTIGSGFYLILLILCIYRLLTLTPNFPGDDTFMAAVGIVFGIIVTITACVCCFIFTGVPRRKSINN